MSEFMPVLSDLILSFAVCLHERASKVHPGMGRQDETEELGNQSLSTDSEGAKV